MKSTNFVVTLNEILAPAPSNLAKSNVKSRLGPRIIAPNTYESNDIGANAVSEPSGMVDAREILLARKRQRVQLQQQHQKKRRPNPSSPMVVSLDEEEDTFLEGEISPEEPEDGGQKAPSSPTPKRDNIPR